METEKLKYIPSKIPRAFFMPKAFLVQTALRDKRVVLKIVLIFLEHWEKITYIFELFHSCLLLSRINLGTIFSPD